MTDDTDDQSPAADLDDVVDAGSAAGVAAAQAKSRRNQKRTDALWSALLRDPVGRQQLWAMLVDLGTFETRYGCGPNGFPVDLQTFFNLGQRDYGLRLLRTLMVIDGEGVLAMHRENDPAFKKGK